MKVDNANNREARNKYHREWCAKNKKRVQAIHQRYWQKKLAALAASEQSEGNNDERKDT